MYAEGWARGEPDEPTVDQPELLEAALSALHRKTGAGIREIAAALNWKPTTFESVTGVDSAVLASARPDVFSLGDFRERRHGTAS
jgi:hypothetical protein